MSHAEFEALKSSFRQRSAGAFIDAFYYFKDTSDRQHLHRPQIVVTCVFQRVPHGSSWTRPLSQGLFTPAQSLAEAQRNPNAPRVPISELPDVEHNLGWSDAQFNAFLTTILDIPLEFLCKVIYGRLYPNVENTAWSKLILQPSRWQNQWLFHETALGDVVPQPRIASKSYNYFWRRSPLADSMIDYSDYPNADDWHNWARGANINNHLKVLLRGLLLSDPAIVSVGYDELLNHGVDLDMLNSPMSWNTIGNQAGSDLDYPGGHQLRNMDPLQFENGLTICNSHWWIKPNYMALTRHLSTAYWDSDLLPGETVEEKVDNWPFWEAEFQRQWNFIFLHESIYSRSRGRSPLEFAGVNIDAAREISQRNNSSYSLLQSRRPGLPLPQNPNRVRLPNPRFYGRGIDITTDVVHEEVSSTPFHMSLSDYVYFCFSHT
jgi:hypothetical protein